MGGTLVPKNVQHPSGEEGGNTGKATLSQLLPERNNRVSTRSRGSRVLMARGCMVGAGA